MAKKIEPICGNCQLFDSRNKRCKVVVIHEGEHYNLPVDKKDKCFFENEFQGINELGEVEKFKPEVQQIKWWVEDPKTGKKSDKGIVKIEYPNGFFPEPPAK